MADPNQQYYEGENYPPQYDENAYDQGQQDGAYQEGDYQQDGQYYEGDQQYPPDDLQFDDQQTYDGQGTTGDYTSVPDILYLNHYCANAMPPRDSSEEARLEAEQSWEPVREWLRTHSADDVRAGAEQRGDSAMTALHFACRNAPPADVVEVFLSIAVDTVQWPDSFGWLPIHYACACGADPEVIKSLAEAFPESKTTVDRRGRTPLHFALGNSNPEKPVSPAVVVLLSSSGAASYADDNGMLPLHYACAYGASEEALFVLTDAHQEAITTMDRRGRTPLHFALSNAGRRAAPAAVRLLLGINNKDIVNSRDGGPLPLRVLAEFASTVRRDDEQRESVQKCLEHLLEAEPDPTADFFTALQSLPDWLQEQAVVMPVVQVLLNEKISQRFPTGVLLMDFYVQVLVVTAYSYLIPISIDVRYGDVDRINALEYVWALYVGASYFLVREVIQILSLISLRAFHIWFYNASSWLNVAYFLVVFVWAYQMVSQKDPANQDICYRDRDLVDSWDEETCKRAEAYKTGAALCVIFLWLKFLSYLRNMLIEFAVFVGGVFYVVRRLAAFLWALAIILIAFAQMFFTIFRQTSTCKGQEDFDISTELGSLRCEDVDKFPYCHMWDAFLSVFTMLLGEVDELLFEGSNAGLALFIGFMFLVVILLANVLIAIVTDSYKVIQDQRAAVVFWTNRLDFIAEMDAIANGPWKTRLKQSLGISSDESNSRQIATFGQEFWKRLIDLFEDDIDSTVMSVEFICYTLLRIGTAVFIIPAWIIIGFFTVGWLWPPQVREAGFTSSVFKHSSDTEKEDELRRTQVRRLKQEVKALKDDLVQELAIDRTQVVQLKSLVAERKLEIQSEMKHIKRIVNMLFEQLASS